MRVPVNEGPTAIALTGTVTSLAEDADTSSATKMGDIVVTDADGGTNTVSLSGADAASFEVVGSELLLKAGVALDYETQTSYAVTLTTGSVSVDHMLSITDVDEAPVNASDIHFWVEKENGNSVVYFQTVEGVSLTSIKLYFDDSFSHDTTLQYTEGTVINPLGSNAWSAVPNASEKSIFLYGTTAQSITSPSSAVKFYVAAGDINLIQVSDASDGNAQTINLEDVSLTNPGAEPVDEGPTAIALDNAVTSLAEDADTSSAIKMGDIVITDADGGTNVVSLSGADAASFEVVGSELLLKAGVALDYKTQTSYTVTLTTGDVSVDHTLSITDVSDIHFWVEKEDGNSVVYFQTVEGVSLTSIKLYFDDSFSHDTTLQYTEGTVINPLGSNAWSAVPNASENSIFLYGTTAQSITSPSSAVKFYVAAGDINLIQVSDVSDGNAQTINLEDVSLTNPGAGTS